MDPDEQTLVQMCQSEFQQNSDCVIWCLYKMLMLLFRQHNLEKSEMCRHKTSVFPLDFPQNDKKELHGER